jgi:hypothetical protein
MPENPQFLAFEKQSNQNLIASGVIWRQGRAGAESPWKSGKSKIKEIRKTRGFRFWRIPFSQ